MFQSQSSTLCILSSGQSSLCDRHILHELEQYSCFCISYNNTNSLCPEQDTPNSVQNSSYSSSLTGTNMILRGSTTSWLSSSSSFTLSKLLTQAKGSFSIKSHSTQPSHLGVIKKSVRDRNFANVEVFVSKSKRTSTQKAYDAKYIIYTHWCHRKKVNLVSAPLSVISDFLFYLFL